MNDETMTVSSEAEVATHLCDTASATTENPPHRGTEAQSKWWRFADLGVLGVWIAVVGFTLQYHEKWCDEAQAWLFARDLTMRKLWFYELRYEGSPGLWHTILWVAQHVFHAKYGALGYIGMAGATAGAAALIFKAPFPRYIRWPLAFTYFMVYQYAVIARQYTLLPLLCFAAASYFRDLRRPGRMTLTLILLANVSFHGTLLAGSIGLGYLVKAIRSWRSLEHGLRNRYWFCLSSMALTFLFLFIVLKPASDSLEIVKKPGLFRPPTFVNVHGQNITSTIKFEAILSGGLLDYPVLSVIFLILAAAWCFTRRTLFVFVIPVGLMIALYSFVYGTAHHQGTLFLTVLTGIWIAWPSINEQRTFARLERRMYGGMIVLLLCLCSINIWDSVVVIYREYLYPYSGAGDAATYLRSVGAERGPIFGYGFGISAVQAYFDHNILANIPTSYTHNGLPGWHNNMDIEEVERINPQYVVAFSIDPNAMIRIDGPLLTSLGFDLVHFSDGYYLFKRGVYEREAYLIFRRVRPPSSANLSSSGLFNDR